MKEKIISLENAEYTYKGHQEGVHDVKALSKINVSIEKGEFVAVIGRNGSGKSTFARLLNVLLRPTKGYVYIKGYNTIHDEYLWEIRNTVGMVFQNPDNQIVGTTVEEDVAFGPENLGVEPKEIVQRVNKSLNTVGILEYREHGPHLLSGGQKQRVAIAGILAMRPECIVLDESTAMLDPIGRKEVMDVVHNLNKNHGITVVHITHHMDETKTADRVVVIDNGNVVMDGTPKEIFSKVEKIKNIGLDVPQVTELLYELRKEGVELPLDTLNIDKAVNLIASRLKTYK